MRNIVWLVLLFAAAVVAALALGDNDGLVSFYWNGWRLDLSLNFFLLAALVGALVAVSALQALNALLGLPRRAREWQGLRRERAAHAALRDGLAEYFAGRYSRAQKSARQAMQLQDEVDDLRNDLRFRQLAQAVAAGSLHRLQDRGRRDELIRQALQQPRRSGAASADEGVRLLAAEWALEDRDGERAEALLAELPPGVGRRTLALRLKLQAQRLSRRPLDALHTARLLANHQAFSAAAAQGLLRSLAFEALDQVHDSEQLRRLWQQFDPADQRDPIVVARAARRAAALGTPEDGRQWLRPAFDKLEQLDAEGRADVALALVHTVAGIGADWLPRVEAAQRQMPTDPAVQAVAGAVYAECQLWGKARRPLELAAQDARLVGSARRAAWRTLAQLAAVEGDEARAALCLAEAATLD